MHAAMGGRCLRPGRGTRFIRVSLCSAEQTAVHYGKAFFPVGNGVLSEGRGRECSCKNSEWLPETAGAGRL